MDNILEEKFKGVLAGLSVGDALGGPLEFMSANQIQIKHGVVNSMIGGGWLHLKPGQYTDDTKLMIFTAESLIENKGININDLIERYIIWYKGNPRDIGITTRNVLALISEQGKSMEEASKEVYYELGDRSNDNDLLPRCVPLALFYYNNIEELMKKTLEVARLTHYNKKIASGSVTLNLLIAEILRKKDEEKKKDILEKVYNILEENEIGIYNMLPDISSKKKEDFQVRQKMQDTLEVSIWAWRYSKSFKEGIVKVINLGGDTDTNGAVTGALLGAYYGVSNIPEEWLKKLDDKNIILNLAKQIYKIVNK